MFSGSIVALVTPFTNTEIDRNALRRLVRFHLDNGTHGIVPTGTTGESPTLGIDEHLEVIELVVNEVAGQIPVIAGAGSNNTAEAIEITRRAEKVGADGALHAMGYYNRPNQEGIYQHFAALSQSSDLALLAYNIPARAIVDIHPETMARLAGLPNVVGVKDATCDMTRPIRERQLMATAFDFLSGEDATAVSYNAQGGSGCISVTANIAPAICASMQTACLEGDFALALDLQRQLMPLHQALFMEPSPAGVKYAASLLGHCEPTCRLPMVPLQQETRTAIEVAIAGLGDRCFK